MALCMHRSTNEELIGSHSFVDWNTTGPTLAPDSALPTRTAPRAAQCVDAATRQDLHEDRRRGHDRARRRPARRQGFAQRVETYGTVDELNSQIGVALAIGLCERLATELPAIQNELFDLGSDLATPATSQARHPVPTVQARHIETLERLIDEFNEVVGPLTNFLLPGGSPGAAQLHVARTVCRRAEREATSLARDETIGPTVLPYLNRLSDALFVMARYENHERGVSRAALATGRLTVRPVAEDRP